MGRLLAQRVRDRDRSARDVGDERGLLATGVCDLDQRAASVVLEARAVAERVADARKLVVARLIAEAGADRAARAGQPGDLGEPADAVVLVLGAPVSLVCLAEQQVRAGLVLVAGRLLARGADRERVAERVAVAVEGDPSQVAARVGDIRLRDLAVAVGGVGELVHAAVGQGLAVDAPIAVVVVLQPDDVARVLDRRQPPAAVVRVFGDAAAGVGHLPEAAGAVVGVADRAAALILHLGDAAGAAVAELEPTAAGGEHLGDVAELAAAQDRGLVAETVANRLQQPAVRERVDGAVGESELPGSAVPKDARLVETARGRPGLQHHVRVAAAGRNPLVANAAAIREDEIGPAVVVAVGLVQRHRVRHGGADAEGPARSGRSSGRPWSRPVAENLARPDRCAAT